MSVDKSIDLKFSPFQDLNLPVPDRRTASPPLSSSPDVSRSVLQLHRSCLQLRAVFLISLWFKALLISVCSNVLL